MPFLILGIIMLASGVYFLRKAIASENKELLVGMTSLIIASVFMILFFGLFYSLTIL